jgi:hypothetical protein
MGTIQCKWCVIQHTQQLEAVKSPATSGAPLFHHASTAIKWILLLWILGISTGLPKIVLAAEADEVDEVYKLIESGRLSEANIRIISLLDNSPDDAMLLFARAVIAEKNGSSENARKFYQDLTQSHPGLLEPYNNLAIHYANAGNLKQAAKTLEQAMQANPAVAIAYRNLSAIYAQLASAAYREALDSTATPEPLQLHSLDKLDAMQSPPAGKPPANNLVINDAAESLPATGPQMDETTPTLTPVTSIEIEPAVEPPVFNSTATPSQSDPE